MRAGTIGPLYYCGFSVQNRSERRKYFVDTNMSRKYEELVSELNE